MTAHSEDPSLTIVQRSVLCGVAREYLEVLPGAFSTDRLLESERNLVQRCRDLLRYEATVVALEAELARRAVPVEPPGAKPLSYAKAARELHDLMDLKHGDLVKRWEWLGHKVDGATSIQKMRCELAREILASTPEVPPTAPDTTRLDWLQERVEGTGEALVMGGVCSWGLAIKRGRYGKEVLLGDGDDLREAIDAAMSAPPSHVEVMPSEPRPEIICFSGSTRFLDEMAVAMWEEEKRGNITLGCHLLPASYTKVGHHLAEELGLADVLDAVHLRKIDLADRLHVINIGGYIGESTRREIAYATQRGKPITYASAPTEEPRPASLTPHVEAEPRKD